MTVSEEKLKELLAENVCCGSYDEEVVRNRVSCVKVFADRIEIFDKYGNVI